MSVAKTYRFSNDVFSKFNSPVGKEILSKAIELAQQYNLISHNFRPEDLIRGGLRGIDLDEQDIQKDANTIAGLALTLLNIAQQRQRGQNVQIANIRKIDNQIQVEITVS